MASAKGSVETVTKTVEVTEERVNLVLTRDEARLVKYLCGSVHDTGGQDAKHEAQVLASGIYSALDTHVGLQSGPIWSHHFGLKVRIETPLAAARREASAF